MTRTLAVLLFLIVTVGSLVATGGQPANPAAETNAQPAAPPATCTPIPDPNCRTAPTTSGVTCKIPLDWFKADEHCPDPHPAIQIGKKGKLKVDSTMGQFTIASIQKRTLTGSTCGSSLGSSTRFIDSHAATPSTSHTVKALKHSDGCYKITFTQGTTTIDPHIIVSGNGQ